MHLRTLQERMEKFEQKREWQGFSTALIFIHAVEELSEIGEHILHAEGYKASSLEGKDKSPPIDVQREFAQLLTLLAQLANRFNANLDRAVETELHIMEKRFPAPKWRSYMRTLTKSNR